MNGLDPDRRDEFWDIGGSPLSLESFGRWLEKHDVGLTEAATRELCDLLQVVYQKGYTQGRRWGWQQVLDCAVDRLHAAGWDYVVDDPTPTGGHVG